MQAPTEAQSTTRKTLSSPVVAALYAAGGTTTSLGNGMKLLSMAISKVMTQ